MDEYKRKMEVKPNGIVKSVLSSNVALVNTPVQWIYISNNKISLFYRNYICPKLEIPVISIWEEELYGAIITTVLIVSMILIQLSS